MAITETLMEAAVKAGLDLGKSLTVPSIYTDPDKVTGAIRAASMHPATPRGRGSLAGHLMKKNMPMDWTPIPRKHLEGEFDLFKDSTGTTGHAAMPDKDRIDAIRNELEKLDAMNKTGLTATMTSDSPDELPEGLEDELTDQVLAPKGKNPGWGAW